MKKNAFNRQETKEFIKTETKIINNNELKLITNFLIFTSFLNNFIINAEMIKKLNITLNV